MTGHARTRLAALLGLLLLPSAARGSSLDVSSSYRLRAVSYTNLNLGGPKNDRSFLTQNARIGIFVKDLLLDPAGEEAGRMDVGAALRGIGVAGSSTALQSPFDRAAARYPDTSFTPFLENAYVRLHQLFGWPLEATFGQQNFSLGSGLLLSDDGAGMAGVSIKGSLPWWGLGGGLFVFQPRNSQAAADSLMTYGASIELPTNGTWQLNQLVEKDRRPVTAAGLPVNKASRYFTGLRYQLNYGPLVFDGEAAIQKGSAVPPGPTPGNPDGTRVTYNGNAQVLKAKWRQAFWREGEGIARLSFARGSGDSGATATTDEAFFPSSGHRYDGLERSGFGDFFAATPYDAFGGHSSSTASGLPAGASGIQSVGLGFTPPAYRGVALDLDYFLFQADRNVGPHRTLGTEFDLRLRYRVRERFLMQLSGAFFTAGPAISASKTNARRYLFEVSGNF